MSKIIHIKSSEALICEHTANNEEYPSAYATKT